MKTLRAPATPAAPETILVPCDFSETSRAALAYAAVLARPFSARLVLLHVIEPLQPGLLTGGGDSRQRQNRQRERAGHQLDRWAKELPPGLRLGRPLVKAGKPWEVIVAVAGRIAAGMIVMGTHGFVGLKHAVLGSVAERVVRHAPCPVLTVRV